MKKLSDLFKYIFKKGDDRSLKIRSNIIIIFLFKGGSLLVNLLLVPITIHFVNPSEYGVWLTLSSVIAWFGISDIGFGNGLRNKFTEAQAQNDTKLAKGYVSTTYISLTCIIAFLWLLFFISSFFLDWSLILNTDPSTKDSLTKVVLILFTFFALQFIFKLVGTVLIASQEPGKASGFDFIANVFILISIYLMIKLNVAGSLEILAVITGSFQLLVYIIATFWFYSGKLKPYRPSIKYFKFSYIRSLMGLGVKFFIVQISMIFIFQCTNIIIMQILDSESVTIYNIAYRYFTIPMTIALIVVSPFWSAFTDAYVKKDYIWMTKVYKQLLKLVLFMIGVLIVFFILSEFAYKIWIKDEVIIPIGVSFVMMLNIIAITISSVFISIINGTGKLKIQLLLNIVLSFFYIPLAIFLGHHYRLIGIIIASFIINLIYAILVPMQCYKIVNNKAHGYWAK